MQTRGLKRLFLVLTLVASMAPATGGGLAQAQDGSIVDRVSSAPIPPPEARGDAVLVAGNPPLTERMAVRYTSVLEWLLEITFTPSSRRRPGSS